DDAKVQGISFYPKSLRLLQTGGITEEYLLGLIPQIQALGGDLLSSGDAYGGQLLQRLREPQRYSWQTFEYRTRGR
ncbi:hypothetical protein CK516_39320, partial [Nostoc sp. 'Peltigera malacea cyanobiont' DB3992]